MREHTEAPELTGTGLLGSHVADIAASQPAAHTPVGASPQASGRGVAPSDTEQRLRRAFARGLNIPESAVNESLEYSVTPGWDSVAHMALVASLDTTFGITLDTDDVIDLSSYQEARGILGRYGIQF